MHCNWPLSSFIVVNVNLLKVFVFSNLNYSWHQLDPNSLPHSLYHLDSILRIASRCFIHFIGQIVHAELLSDGRSVSACGGRATLALVLSFLPLVGCFASRVGLRSCFQPSID